MIDLILSNLPLAITALAGSAMATKYLKNAIEAVRAWSSGVFAKLPPNLTRTIAVLLGLVVASISGDGGAVSDATVGVIASGIGTTLIALLGKLKPKRPTEAPVGG